jgi:hypothetical protein
MKVLNFGSLNIDYVYDVDNFVRKGETISSKGLNVFCGGKGLNQSVALARAGADVYHAGMIGKDGIFLVDFLKNSGVNVDNILIRDDIRTGNAIIQREISGDNCIILFAGANRSITRDYVDKVLEKFGRGDYIVLQNEISELPYIVESAHRQGMKIVLNPSPMDEIIGELNLSYIDYFLLNETEALKLSGIDKFDSKKCMSGLVNTYKGAGVLITLGDKGAIYSDGNIFVEQKAVKTKAVDTTAAGDTFTGYFVNGILGGKEIKEAINEATIAASIAVSRIGAAPSIPAMNEVKERLKNL